VTPSGDVGHSVSGLYKNFGPFHETLLSTNSCSFEPRDGMSAGLSLPGQNLHSSFDVNLRISSTRCQTYCFHTLLLLVQNKVVNESVQYTISISFANGKTFLTLLISRTRIVAPKSSNLGMLCCLIGATFVLDEMSRTSMCPSS
jgi:hypothetical protein